MEPEGDIEESGAEPQRAGRQQHAAGAGIGLVGLFLGFGIFSASVMIGLYLWGAKHNFLFFVAAVSIGYIANFTLRRLSLR